MVWYGTVDIGDECCERDKGTGTLAFDAYGSWVAGGDSVLVGVDDVVGSAEVEWDEWTDACWGVVSCAVCDSVNGAWFIRIFEMNFSVCCVLCCVVRWADDDCGCRES